MMDGEGLDLGPAKKLARGKNQKLWLDALTSEDGLVVNEWVEKRGKFSNYSNIKDFIWKLKWDGYTVSTEEVVVGPRGGKSKVYRVTAYSVENRDAVRLGVMLRGGQVTIPGIVDPSEEVAAQIAGLGPDAVTIAYELIGDQWDGTLPDLVDVVRSLVSTQEAPPVTPAPNETDRNRAEHLVRLQGGGDVERMAAIARDSRIKQSQVMVESEMSQKKVASRERKDGMVMEMRR